MSEYVEGQALVASPHLADRNFARTVVYIVKHDEDGAYGLILNSPSDVTVGELIQQVLEQDVENLDPIFVGGPVEGPIVVIHELPATNSAECKPGVHLSSNQDDLEEVCLNLKGRFRVFNGYSGWAPGQLEDELRQGGWLVCQLDKEDIFSPPDELWQNAVRQIGRSILEQAIPIGPLPEDPTWN